MKVLKLSDGDSAHNLVTQKLCVMVGIAVAILSLLFGFLVTYFVMKESPEYHSHTPEPAPTSTPPLLSPGFVRQHLFANINATEISNWLRHLTLKPQMAGSDADGELAKYVLDEWKSFGLENSSLVSYKVMLSYPNWTKPNVIERVSENNTTMYSTNKTERPLNFNELDPEYQYYASNPPFLAYAPSTGAQPMRGNLVYVNYGRAEDYTALRRNYPAINLNGTIAIARFGQIFRGNILKFAQENGAKALIIYSDPIDYTRDGLGTYPDSVYLPPSGAQRGTTMIGDGDPLTPRYPSIDSAYRIPIEDAILPEIPAHCIGYGDAIYLLSGLKGNRAADIYSNYSSGLDIDIYVGYDENDNSFGYANQDSVTIEVNNVYETMKEINNVLSVITGCVEPDRYVLVGNHRDSWTFGAIDPSSGTAAMLALSKAIATVMREQSWCPRRSIVFCSWGAEEYGLLGSTEWVEQNQKLLLSQAVAYLNVDSAVTGNASLAARSTPLLYKAIWDASNQVINPDPAEVQSGRNTVYDTYKYRFNTTFNGSVVAWIDAPGGGSDHGPFLQLTGVPVIDFRYRCARGDVCNPNYHTMYETFHIQSQMMDRGFNFNKAVAQVWAELVRSLADTEVLPLSIDLYPVLLTQAVTELISNEEYNKIFLEQNISPYLGNLSLEVEKFKAAVDIFATQLQSIDTSNALVVRRVNDVLMLLERAFLDDEGLPLRPEYKHVVLAPSSLNSYSGSSFPGVYDLMWTYFDAIDRNLENPEAILEKVKKHISVISFHVNAATKFVAQNLF